MLEELDIPDFFLGRSRIRVIYPGCIEVAGNVTLQLIKFLQFASARRAHITLPSYIVYLLRGSANFMSSLVIQKILSGFYYTVDLLFRPLDFGLTGILYSLSKPLAEAKISIFAISTFDTDYILVKQEKLQETIYPLTGEQAQTVIQAMKIVKPEILARARKLYE